MVNDAKGQTVYRDHLPLLGEQGPGRTGPHGLQIGDQVNSLSFIICLLSAKTLKKIIIIFYIYRLMSIWNWKLYNRYNMAMEAGRTACLNALALQERSSVSMKTMTLLSRIQVVIGGLSILLYSLKSRYLSPLLVQVLTIRHLLSEIWFRYAMT